MTQSIEEVRFVVWGDPVPQGSMVGLRSKTTGVIFVKPSNERELKLWRKEIATAAGRAMAGREPLRVPLRVLILAALHPPAAAAKRVYPDEKPDGDKLMRAVLDGLTGIVVDDDKRFVDKQIRKRYAGRPGSLPQPGVRVIVSPMPVDPLAT